MKPTKIFISLALSISILLGCNSQKAANSDVCLRHYSVDKYNNVEIIDSIRPIMLEEGGLATHNVANIIWPAAIEGKTPTDLQREIMKIAFNDSASKTIEQSLERFEKSGYGFSPEQITKCEPTDAAHANKGEFYQSVRVELERANDRMYVFSIFHEDYFAGAAHGMYTQTYVSYDRKNNSIIGLDKLISDRNRLRQMLYEQRKADLKEEADEYEAFISDEFPISESFYINGSVIVFVYQPYDIAPYADGIQMIELDYYDLNKAGILTEYAKKLMM